MSNLISISSVRSESVASGTMVIDTRWKSTEKRTIPATRAYRAVEVPADIWQSTVSVHADKTMQLFMHDAIMELAKSYLSTIVEESDWIRTTVPAEDFQLSALLTWNAERAAMSGRLNGDEIKAWVANSYTVKHVATLHSADIAKAVGEQFVKLASPNHGISAEKATKLLAGLWQEKDAENNTGLRVLLKLQAISAKKESANVLDSIL